jgi:DNA/RNA endonuclease G (NUC1)
MAPQAGSLNRGIWKLLETNVRGWAVQLNQVYTIYVGGVYKPFTIPTYAIIAYKDKKK